MSNLNKEQYLEELKYLVNIDSGSHTPEGVKKVAEFFRDKYNALGLKAELLQFSEKAGPCLQVTNSDKCEYDVLLVGHMDTVFPEGTVKARSFKIDGDKAYGPGVIDMKSGLLSMYYAIEYLVKNDKLAGKSICVFQNSDEEISSAYSNPKITELSKVSKAAFVLEPARPNGALVKERKGLAKYNIELIGKAAHAGVDPKSGISAINELAHWITELHSLTDFVIGTTLNVGVVSGGTVANVVAEHATAQVDLRYKIPSEIDRVESKIEELIQNPKTVGIKATAIKAGHRPPMNMSPESEKLIELVKEVAKDLNMELDFVGTGGGSDANFISAMGVPVLDGMGPVGGGSHGVNEYIEISSIEPRLNLLINTLLKL